MEIKKKVKEGFSKVKDGITKGKDFVSDRFDDYCVFATDHPNLCLCITCACGAIIGYPMGKALRKTIVKQTQDEMVNQLIDQAKNGNGVVVSCDNDCDYVIKPEIIATIHK